MKRSFIAILLLCIGFFLYGNSQTEQLTILKKTFYRGNLQDKIQVVTETSVLEGDFEEIYLIAMDFVIDYADILKDDSSMINLAKITVENLEKINSKKILDQTFNLFLAYDSDILKFKILELIANMKINDEKFNVAINEYGESLLASNEKFELLPNYISILEKLNNPSFFNMLFKIAAAENLNVDVKKQAEKAIASIDGNNKSNIISIIENGTIEEKQLALRIVLNNDKNSDFLRAEIAEKALQVSILYIGDIENKNQLINFQLDAIRELRRVSWTRSSDLVVQFFNYARSEYETGLIKEDEYLEIISCVEELASTKASALFSDYLAFFNSQTEQGISCSEPVVFAVIKALGNLGNKIAFDNLLYVGYLSYSEEIIEASRIALAGLKF